MNSIAELRKLKSAILIELDAAKAAHRSADVLRLGRQAAELEGQLATEFMAAGRLEDAAVSFISQAACLEDADLVQSAFLALDRAATLTSKPSTNAFIEVEQERLRLLLSESLSDGKAESHKNQSTRQYVPQRVSEPLREQSKSLFTSESVTEGH